MKTNKQKIILVLVLLLALIFGAVWFFASFNQDPTEEGEGGTRNLFPFGEIFEGIGFGNGGSQGTTDDPDGTGEQTTDGQTPEEDREALVLISDQPTGGMIPLIREKEEQVQTTTFDEEGNPIQTTETITVQHYGVRYSTILDGSIYETMLTGDTAMREELVVENFIPNAEYAYFSDDASKVAFQYWNDENRSIDTYYGSITPVSLDVKACPFDFSGGITVGEESQRVFQVHQFLNRDIRTQVAAIGVNSPGNEGSLAGEETMNAIKKFQTLYEIGVDGALGPQTRGEMIRVCNEQQQAIAEAERDELESEYEMSGFFLPQNIISLGMDPNNEEIFYLGEEGNGVIGTLMKFSDQSRRTIFTSPFSEWTSVWNHDDYIELTTKPSYASLGYSYELETADGDFHKSFKERLGLGTLPSRDNEKLLVFDVEEERPQLSLYTRETSTMVPLGIESFVDKCVWSYDSIYLYCAVPNSFAYGELYPDTWYQGLEHYRDSLFRINTVTLEEEVVSNISVDFGEEIDVERIIIDQQGQYLYFIDKQTEYLWGYRLDTL